MKPPTILIVDDENGQRELIRSYIEPRMKCAIAEAASGVEAIDYIRRNPCDLMILDIKMPEQGGLEVLDVAKDLPVSVIVFSAWDSEHVFDACSQRRVAGYVTKGTSLKILGDKIAAELKKKCKYEALN